MKHLEDLEYIALQLKALSHSIDTFQSQFEIQCMEEEVISSFVTLNHCVNHIKGEVEIKISDIVGMESMDALPVSHS